MRIYLKQSGEAASGHLRLGSVLRAPKGKNKIGVFFEFKRITEGPLVVPVSVKGAVTNCTSHKHKRHSMVFRAERLEIFVH